MTWSLLFHLLPVLVLVLTLVQLCWDYLLKHVYKDARTNDHHKLRTRLLGLTVCVVVMNYVIAEATNYQKGVKEKQLLEQMQQQATRIELVNSNQSKLIGQNQALLGILATNPAIAPATRKEIVNSTQQYEVIRADVVDLNAWRSELDRKLHLDKITREEADQRNLVQEKATMQKWCRIYDDCRHRFRDLLSQIAAQKNDQLRCNFSDFPEIISNEQMVAEMKFVTNSNWCFQAIIGKHTPRVSRMFPPHFFLRDTSKQNISLVFQSSFSQPEELNMRLNLPGDKVIESTVELSSTNFKSSVDELLRNFIAAENLQNSDTN